VEFLRKNPGLSRRHGNPRYHYTHTVPAIRVSTWHR